MSSIRDQAWTLFDHIVDVAPLGAVNPWRSGPAGPEFEPDDGPLQLLLGVPIHLNAMSQSGVPALAFDVWVSYELRRAGFESDWVWPRPMAPRVLPREVLQFIDALPKNDRDRLRQVVSTRGTGGSSAANLLGKNYVKQVDVVMSSWATGPELLISTKRMDSSFGKNAANRVEESYGDAKNLRLRHPRAALGFLYGLGAAALTDEPGKAHWLMDLLAKLGREDDAYDAVGLVIPEVPRDAVGTDEAPDPAGPLEAGATVEPPDAPATGVSSTTGASPVVQQLPHVTLRREEVPAELDPGRFFRVMCSTVLDRTPINFHSRARALRDAV